MPLPGHGGYTKNIMPERDSIKTGERRTATILFSDMKGFTSLSERSDPEVMDALMNRVFGVFEEIIKGYGGFVEKYIGDALVAVFGVPELHEDDPSRAVHAALDFLVRVRDISAGASGPPLAFRTGIHEGLVTTGRRGDFDVVTGHAMSVAQRLEAAASPGSILVSEEVKEKCEEDFEFSQRRDIEVKGRTEPIAAYEVRGESPASPRGSGRDAGAFIGRRALVDELLKAYMRGRGDEVSGFFLTGEAGMGKSRLLQAFVDKLRLFPDFTAPILFARAQKYRTGGFALIVDLLLGHLGLDAQSGREEALRALARFAPHSGTSVERFVDLVCCKDADQPDAASIAALYDVFESVLVSGSSELFPILVAIDNANFMDRLSREFFLYVFKAGRIKPFFLLAGREFSPELRRAFQGLRSARLEGLSREESEELVRSRWPGVEGEPLRRVVEAGMGNPLFLREYASYGRKHGDLSTLPATVQNIFLAGLDRYPQEWRELAARLSVFAHSFSLEEALSIQAAAGGDPSIVEPALARFEKDSLIAGESRASGCAYSFRADLFKKALYYYSRAEVGARSVQNVLRTMALARLMRSEAEEARLLVERCAGIPGGDPFELLEARAEFQLLGGDYGSALATTRESLDSMPAERSASRFYACDYMLRALWQLCDFAGIREAASRLLAAGSLSEPVLSQANAMYAFALVFHGEREEARERFVQAEFYAEQILNDFSRIEALRTLALCSYLAGEGAKAESSALEALTLTLALRHSCLWPAFTLLVLLAEQSAEGGREDRARFFLVEAFFLFTTGTLLPTKDLVLYYYLAATLLDPEAAERNMAVALRLLEEEKARLGSEDRIANFLSLRSYAKIQRILEGSTK